MLKSFNSMFWQYHRKKAHLLLTNKNTLDTDFLSLIVNLHFPQILVYYFKLCFQNILAYNFWQFIVTVF